MSSVSPHANEVEKQIGFLPALSLWCMCAPKLHNLLQTNHQEGHQKNSFVFSQRRIYQSSNIWFAGNNTLPTLGIGQPVSATWILSLSTLSKDNQDDDDNNNVT